MALFGLISFITLVDYRLLIESAMTFWAINCYCYFIVSVFYGSCFTCNCLIGYFLHHRTFSNTFLLFAGVFALPFQYWLMLFSIGYSLQDRCFGYFTD